MAKYIVLVGFSSPSLSCHKGETVDITDKTIIADLKKAGYIEEVKTKKKAKGA